MPAPTTAVALEPFYTALFASGLKGADSIGTDRGSVSLLARVDDIETTLRRACELGGRRLWGPTEIHEGLVLGMLEDPDGNRIGLVRS